jgi:hypothetical protein
MRDDPPSSGTSTASALRPPASGSLGIGVTGHRLGRLGDVDLDALRTALRMLLIDISGGRAPMRIVTSLADGADTIAAEEALGLGWALDAVLPLPRADYLSDFADAEARAGHEALLTSAHSVFELDGDRNVEGGSAIAYERAGRVVLAQSDILVAVWDSGPVRGRGGAAQIVAEAVLAGVPVIHVDPAGRHPPRLLWDGLEEHDLGQQTVDTVPQGDMTAVPGLVRGLLDPPEDRVERAMLNRLGVPARPRRNWALAYPLLLAIMGVRRLRQSDWAVADAAHAMPAILGPCSGAALNASGFGDRLRAVLAPRFARADATATHVAQLFRSGYVTNFSFAALAVVLSLLGLALPAALKPLLVILEFLVIATILLLTRAGHRSQWHRRWLDNRHLAERLRCLAVAAQLGELELRSGAELRPGWVDWYARATARELGLPSVRVDRAYLACVRDSLTTLIDGQIAYLQSDAHRMHRLEHRLHQLGTILFAATALICVGLLIYKMADKMVGMAALDAIAHPVLTATTIASAALPAIGAAIYGIRMQGDFAGIAERSESLARNLGTLRQVIDADALSYDTLKRRVARATDLLTQDLASWLQTYHARPLTLPG